jgi:hypothetical protein
VRRRFAARGTAPHHTAGPKPPSRTPAKRGGSVRGGGPGSA